LIGLAEFQLLYGVMPRFAKPIGVPGAVARGAPFLLVTASIDFIPMLRALNFPPLHGEHIYRSSLSGKGS
jgi:hypothetical protein